jgi:hypothetical protein
MNLKMTPAQFRRLTSNTMPKGIGKSELMRFHLLLVEAVHGRLSQEELRSTRFAESRDKFVKLLNEWKGKE